VRISRPLLEALAEASNDPAALRPVISACIKLENPDLACQILERIPVSDRLTGDWLDLGVAHGYSGRYAEAVAATRTAMNLDDGRWKPWCLNNQVWFGLRAQPDASAQVRAGWLRDLEEARRLLAEKKPAGWKEVTQLSHGTEAEVHRALGDAPAAFRALAEAEALGPLVGSRLLVRARVLAMGDPPLGRLDAERALERLHPESLEAGEARALIARLDAASAKT
jgi:tetratricopeptide (TPR) repeat protein